MKKRSTRKQSPATFLVSPLPTPSSRDRSPSVSPMKFDFNFDASFKPTASPPLKKNNDGGDGSVKKKNNSGGKSTPGLMQPTDSPPSLTKSLSSISGVKDLATSKLDSLKRHLDCSHSEIVKDVEASASRLHKRLKIQTQTCQQMMDEAEKEYKKMMEQIEEKKDAMKASYTELIAEAQASTSRVCKTSIPELLQSFEKSIDGLRSRYGVSST